MMHRKKRLVSMAVVTIAAVLSVAIFARPSNAAAAETFADYSMMFAGPDGFAGQLWSNNSAVSQWAWHHTSSTQADIDWGSPANWPQGAAGPGDLEHFSVNGPWVVLSGWSGTVNGQTSNGHDYTQVVTSESIGTGDCSAMVPMVPADGQELYTLYNVPSYNYCTDATGTITNNFNSTVVHFEHWQRWSKVACSNTYFSGDTCLQQDEKWWDDNGHPYQLETQRTGWLAKGKGWYESNNQVINGVPNTTSLSERYYWSW